jgi:hypothetical protein
VTISRGEQGGRFTLFFVETTSRIFCRCPRITVLCRMRFTANAHVPNEDRGPLVGAIGLSSATPAKTGKPTGGVGLAKQLGRSTVLASGPNIRIGTAGRRHDGAPRTRPDQDSSEKLWLKLNKSRVPSARRQQRSPAHAICRTSRRVPLARVILASNTYGLMYA